MVYSTVLTSQWSTVLYLPPNGLLYCTYLPMVYCTVLTSQWSTVQYISPNGLLYSTYLPMVYCTVHISQWSTLQYLPPNGLLYSTYLLAVLSTSGTDCIGRKRDGEEEIRGRCEDTNSPSHLLFFAGIAAIFEPLSPRVTLEIAPKWLPELLHLCRQCGCLPEQVRGVSCSA